MSGVAIAYATIIEEAVTEKLERLGTYLGERD
jgi:hypothetical protein